jgi:hypothetical protein
MQIVEKSTKFESIRYSYAVFRSKTGMKRDNWVHLESFASLEEVGSYLKRVYNRYNYPDDDYLSKFKFKVMLREQTIKCTIVSPKELMVMRMKYEI